jgi:peroxiredoxin
MKVPEVTFHTRIKDPIPTGEYIWKNVTTADLFAGKRVVAMGMSVNKANLGFGFRSWRYAMVVNDGEVEQLFEEPGKVGNCSIDPYEVSDPDTVLNYLKTYAQNQ